MFRKSIFAVLMLIPCVVFAGGWQGYSFVNGFVFEAEEDGSRVYVSMTVTTNHAEDNCPYGASEWKRINGSTVKGKHMLSSVLAAYAAKQRIQLHLDGCDDWGRNIVTGVMVHD